MKHNMPLAIAGLLFSIMLTGCATPPIIGTGLSFGAGYLISKIHSENERLSHSSQQNRPVQRYPTKPSSVSYAVPTATPKPLYPARSSGSSDPYYNPNSVTAVPSQKTATEQAAASLKQGIAAYESGEYQNAVVQLRGVQQCPYFTLDQQLQAKVYLAIAYLMNGDAPAGRMVFRQALDLDAYVSARSWMREFSQQQIAALQNGAHIQ